MYYITTPYTNSNLVCVWFEEPESYIMAIEELPQGSGSLELVNGELVRINNEGFFDYIEDKQPTQLDRIEAQITYTAMMTDTLLEE